MASASSFATTPDAEPAGATDCEALAAEGIDDALAVLVGGEAEVPRLHDLVPAGAEAVRTILLISGVVCLAACLSGTAAQNFKTALIVGGTPRSLQTGLIIAVIVTSLLAAPLMAFLDRAFGIGSEKLLAPQAGMFSAMAKGLFMEGSSLPWNMIRLGVLLSIVLILLGEYLQRRGSSFGISPMAVAVGIYLPFTTTLPILLGGIVHLLVSRRYAGSKKLDSAIQAGTDLCELAFGLTCFKLTYRTR